MNCILSIIIPAYNVERFISAAIQSALGQTLHNIEVIVINDGSTDGTLKEINSINDARLSVITKQNSGLSATRNGGIKVSKGKYVGFLDGDDMWLPEKANLHISILEKNPSIGITYNYHAYIDEVGNYTGQFLITKNHQPTIIDLLTRNCITSDAIVRKECFIAAGLFDESLTSCEDWEMWVRIYHKTHYRARLIPKVLTCYRTRSSSLTMDFEVFLFNSKKVIGKFESGIPFFTEHLRRRALAENYRIASRKSLSVGKLDISARYILKAMRCCPSILFKDIRAFGTFALIMLETFVPACWRGKVYILARKIMKIFYRHYILFIEKAHI